MSEVVAGGLTIPRGRVEEGQEGLLQERPEVGGFARAPLSSPDPSATLRSGDAPGKEVMDEQGNA